MAADRFDFEGLVQAGYPLQRFAEGFRRDALSYGFALNLVPIFPYALIIVVPAACGVGLRTFVAGLFLGLIPGTFLFARLGSGLQQVLVSGAPLRLASFVTPEIVLSLCGLAALALVPIVLFSYPGHLRGLVPRPAGDTGTLDLGGHTVLLRFFDGAGVHVLWRTFAGFEPVLGVAAAGAALAWLVRRPSVTPALAVVLAFALPYLSVLGLYRDSRERFVLEPL